MKIKDFLKKCKVSERDQKIVKKLFGDLEKTEKEWGEFLKDKIVFKKIEVKPKTKKTSNFSKTKKETKKEKK